MVAILVLLTVAVFIVVHLVLSLVTREGRKPVPTAASQPPERMLARLPAGVFVHPGHTWAELLRSGTVRVGVDGFLGRVLGDAGRLVLPSPGDHVRQGERLLTVEQDGRRLEVRAPLSGVVGTSNPFLDSGHGGLGRAAADARWVCTLSPSRLGEEIPGLTVGEAASSWLTDELTRLADWLASLSAGRPGMAMQDGGLPAYGALSQLGAEAWAQFQQQFLNAGAPGRGGAGGLQALTCHQPPGEPGQVIP